MPAVLPIDSTVAHRGGWLRSAENAYEIRGKTLGIVGYGSIGTQLSVLAEALGMQVVFFDVVSLHVPETQATQWMIGQAEIAAMKPGSVLIGALRHGAGQTRQSARHHPQPRSFLSGVRGGEHQCAIKTVAVYAILTRAGSTFYQNPISNGSLS